MMRLVRFLFLLSMATPPALFAVYLSKQGAMWAYERFTFDPNMPLISFDEIYFGVMLWFYVFFSLFMVIPKCFIYWTTLRKEPRKLKYDLAIYYALPLLCFLFLPGEQMVTIAFCLFMTAALMETLDLHLPAFPTQPR